MRFTGPTPQERIGLADQADQEQREPIGSPTAADPAKNRGSLYAALTAAGIIAIAAAGYYFWSTSERVDLRYFDNEIANPDEILVEAEELFRDTATVDGATVVDDARCFFGPDNGLVGVFCGPVWLGRSNDDEPWLLMNVNYDIIDQEAVGQVDSVRTTTGAEPRSLSRPDGARPAEVPSPVHPATGPRLADGSLLLDPENVIGETEAAFAAYLTAPTDDPLTAADDPACFLRQGPDLIHDLPVTDSNLWCGPARTADSRDDRIWLPVNVSLEPGPTYGSSQFESAQVFSSNLQALPEGATLFRPDGATPPDADGVNRPPVATDFATVVDYRLSIDGSQPAATGRLVTDRYEIEFDSLVRTDQIGSGAQSFAAPPDHDLVVAGVAPSERPASPRGVLVVDGSERPLPNWRSGDGGATLVVVVPSSAREVAMTVENNGRPQTISLLDGTLGDGFPLALYRPEVQLNEPFSLRIDMPVGEAVLVSGVLETALWSAVDGERNWLPEGESDLLFTFDDWDVDRPCCDVRVDDVVPTFTLTAGAVSPAPTGDSTTSTTTAAAPSLVDDQRDDPTRAPSNRGPFFRVPEDTERVTLQLDVTVNFTADDQPGTISESLQFEVILP